MEAEASKVSMSYADYNDIRHKEEKWSSQFLFFSVAIFLSITSCLTMVTVLSNFALTYQTQNMLIDMFSEQNGQYEISTQLPVLINATPTSDAQRGSTDAISPSTDIRSTQLSSTTTSMKTDSSQSVSSSTPHADINITITSTTGTTEILTSPVKRNPVQILNEINNKATFFCVERCSHPMVIAAQLNVSLSGKRDTFLFITKPVVTTDVAVAKRGAAFLALNYIYTDRVNESWIDPEWDLSVPSERDCEVPGKRTWSGCKN